MPLRHQVRSRILQWRASRRLVDIRRAQPALRAGISVRLTRNIPHVVRAGRLRERLHAGRKLIVMRRPLRIASLVATQTPPDCSSDAAVPTGSSKQTPVSTSPHFKVQRHDTHDAHDQVCRVQCMRDRFPDGHCRGRMRFRAILRGAESIPETGREQRHFGASENSRNTPEDVVVAELLVGFDGLCFQKNAKDPLLQETERDNRLEAYNLAESPLALHQALHVTTEPDDRQNAGTDTDTCENLDPNVSELRSKTAPAEMSGGLGGFLDDDGKNLDDRILENKHPGYLGPGEARW